MFVVDTSGSMAENDQIADARATTPRSKLNAAKDELWSTVARLHRGSRFNVIGFATIVSPWFDGPRRATRAAKARCRERLDVTNPGGATATWDALMAALDQPRAEAVDFLTDGMPTVGLVDTDAILRGVDERRRALPAPPRIHAIAFLLPEGEAFLSALAAGCGGRYRLQR